MTNKKVILAFILLAIAIPAAFQAWNELSKVVPPAILFGAGVCGVVLILTISVTLMLMELGRTTKAVDENEYYENLSNLPGVLIITKPEKGSSRTFRVIGTDSGRFTGPSNIIQVDPDDD